ncbi:hypothetical protein C8P70_11735 [Myroides indicus]|uniref:Uncharacterized protein n=1 Tax=Myroides indicus TaxID=1323422 RepID=A0A4R7ET07_9FLAO|nr:hypothetical protein C8P70_11735 [Myroides indicus]
MKNIIILSVISTFSWFYYFYERKKDSKKNLDWVTKFWYLGLDVKVLIFAIGSSFLTLYFLIEYIKEM